MTSERKLLVAILAQAITDLADGSADARAWIDSPEAIGDAEHFTFLQCCHEIGLRPSAIRHLASTPAGLAELRRRFAQWSHSQGTRTNGRQIGYGPGFKRGAAA